MCYRLLSASHRCAEYMIGSLSYKLSLSALYLCASQTLLQPFSLVGVCSSCQYPQLFIMCLRNSDTISLHVSALLFAALAAQAEIPALFSQRPIVLRQSRVAMYHPAIDSLAYTLVDMPIAFATLVIFSITLYFIVGLRQTAGQFLYVLSLQMPFYAARVLISSQYLLFVPIHHDDHDEILVPLACCSVQVPCASADLCRPCHPRLGTLHWLCHPTANYDRRVEVD